MTSGSPTMAERRARLAAMNNAHAGWPFERKHRRVDPAALFILIDQIASVQGPRGSEYSLPQILRDASDYLAAQSLEICELRDALHDALALASGWSATRNDSSKKRGAR